MCSTSQQYDINEELVAAVEKPPSPAPLVTGRIALPIVNYVDGQRGILEQSMGFCKSCQQIKKVKAVANIIYITRTT